MPDAWLLQSVSVLRCARRARTPPGTRNASIIPSRDDGVQPPRVYYRVVRGDTVGSIAATFGLRDDDVLAQAGLTKPTSLREGMMLALRVPGGVLARLAQRSTETD